MLYQSLDLPRVQYIPYCTVKAHYLLQSMHQYICVLMMYFSDVIVKHDDIVQLHVAIHMYTV